MNKGATRSKVSTTSPEEVHKKSVDTFAFFGEQVDTFDSRVMCVACWFLVAASRCRNWRAARLSGPEVGAIKALPQRCPGYAPPPCAQAPPTPAAPPHKTEPRPNATERDRGHDRADHPFNRHTGF